MTDIQQDGAGIVIQGHALGPLYYCVMAGVREARRNGHNIGPFIALQAATLAAHRAMSGVGHQYSGLHTDGPQSDGLGDDDSMLSIAEAAALSGYCERQVRRKARAGQGHRVGTSWVMTRGAALALKHQREWKERNAARRTPHGIPGQLETRTPSAG